jgi:hypothetical protein
MERRDWIFCIKLFAVGCSSYDPIFRSEIRIRLLVARAIFHLFQPDACHCVFQLSFLYTEDL